MKSIKIVAIWAGIAVGTASMASCSGDGGGSVAAPESVGTVGVKLQIGRGILVNTVNWSIVNPKTAFTQSGSVNVQSSNTISFQVGGLPAGAGYAISLSSASVDGSIGCIGSSGFEVTTGATNPVDVVLNCSTVAADAGGIAVNGTTQNCANVTSLGAIPLETTVDHTIALSATATAGPDTATFNWTAIAGSFDNPTSPTPVFTCPSAPTDVTITVAVAPAPAGCNTITSQSITVHCDALNPTFTNVYSNVIGQRCTGCHRPGGSGVTVGGLDMSTQAAAYANLVGVTSAGTSAGSSGVTCASAAILRVAPAQSFASLLLNKVNSKLTGTLALCGSPMPLPATANPLSQSQIDLIKTWIDNGAAND